MADIFLSFAPEDSAFADRIARGLDRAGLTVSRPPAAATEQWQRRLYDSIDEASAILVLWSRSSVNQEWIQMEAAIGQYFASLVSVRIDPDLPVTEIPLEYRDPQTGEINEIFETELVGNKWGGSPQDALDRRLAGICGKIRHLKARGPTPSHAMPAQTVADETEVSRMLREGFTWRRAGHERNAAMPALAATRRETAFRAAYSALSQIEHPTQVRAGLADFTDFIAARRGLARVYGEAQQRNDPEFWGQVARLAMPISSSLTAAALQRAGLRGEMFNDLIEPRDSKEMHAERVGRVKGRASVVAWPIAAVAALVVAVVAAPFVTSQMRDNNAPAEIATAPSAAPSVATEKSAPVQTASAADAIDRDGPRLYDPKAFAPPPWAAEKGAPTIVEAPPVPKMSDGPIIPASTAPIAASATAVAKATVTAVASAPRSLPDATASTGASTAWSIPIPPAGSEANRVRLCRAAPDASEQVVEVLSDENFMDVAWRVNIADPAQVKMFVKRNEGCLNARQLTLSDGTQITGANLLFPGDKLIVPSLIAIASTVAPTGSLHAKPTAYPDPSQGWVLLPEGWSPNQTSTPTNASTPTWSASPATAPEAGVHSAAPPTSSLPYFPSFSAPASPAGNQPQAPSAPQADAAPTWSLEAPKDQAITTGRPK